MKLALDRFADNPVIDELLCWIDSKQAIKSLRACAPVWRKPFIEIEYRSSKKTEHMHFAKEHFIEYWSEAAVILETLTDIELISEFKCHNQPDREATAETIIASRNACIRDCEAMFESGSYQVFLDQFGPNCKNLPDNTLQKIDSARAKLD